MAEAEKSEGGLIAMWASCSAAQVVGAFLLYHRAYRASSMPARAFFIASLGLGASASAAVAALHSVGITRLDDVKQIGQSIRESVRGRERS